MNGCKVIENLDSLWFFGTTAPAIQELENPTLNDVEGEEIATPMRENNNAVLEDQDGGFGFGCETKTEVEISTKEEKRRSRSRIRRSSCSCLRQRRKILGEIDLNFVVKEISECWMFEEQRIRGEVYKKKKMPPFEDSMAMKEHIRSWAYAVACTVR
ncbi:uncharacterized protein LOC111010848 [Momordica charantia]|uniref:Uncharacterized protein LOC111010848 n=1 Tax=Momordica charantia TaxID=3673 RepID=A0A6J1CFW9_MOMCH|nr:uncharacterized protein LOC111010848 [Momordica charantia]